MRSDLLDELFSRAFERPVQLSWEGGVADSLRGCFPGLSLEVGGAATAWLRLERIRMQARRARLTPGLPGRLAVEAPELSVTVGQRDVDRWARRFRLPFQVRLTESGLLVDAQVAGLAVGELETTLEVVGGWFVLQPRHARLLGLPAGLARWFRTYLPLPPLSPGSRLVGVDHAPEELTLHLGLDGFEEDLTPGLAGRLRRRLLPRLG